MSQWKSIDVLCQEEVCNYKWWMVVERQHENDDFECPRCKSVAKKTISAPKVLSASWPDGHRRADGMGRAMEIDRLERAMDDVEGDSQASMEVLGEMVRKQEEG